MKSDVKGGGLHTRQKGSTAGCGVKEERKNVATTTRLGAALPMVGCLRNWFITRERVTHYCSTVARGVVFFYYQGGGERVRRGWRSSPLADQKGPRNPLHVQVKHKAKGSIGVMSVVFPNTEQWKAGKRSQKMRKQNSDLEPV